MAAQKVMVDQFGSSRRVIFTLCNSIVSIYFNQSINHFIVQSVSVIFVNTRLLLVVDFIFSWSANQMRPSREDRFVFMVISQFIFIDPPVTAAEIVTSGITNKLISPS